MFIDTMGRGGGRRRRTEWYKLDGHKTVPCYDLLEWGLWFEYADRRVAFTPVHGVNVSTVFIGLDHQYGDGPPLVFETMIFGGGEDGWMDRCSTWDEAEKQHRLGMTVARSASRKPSARVRAIKQREAIASLRSMKS